MGRQKTKKQEMNRRELLQWLGKTGLVAAAASPFNLFLNSLVNGIINKAYAQAIGANPRSLLCIQFIGGPARWMYDLFLNPHPSLNQANYVPNPCVATNYVAGGGRYDSTTYATTPIYGIQAPVMWAQSVPTPGGGTRPMSDLLLNLLAIQGLKATGVHPVAQRELMAPLGTLQSFTALSADYSSAPMKAVQTGYGPGSYYFMSKFQNSFTAVNRSGANTNLISTLLTPFTRGSSTQFKTDKLDAKTAIDKAEMTLASFAASEHPGASIVNNDRKSAIDLMTRSFGDLPAVWNSSVNKYRDLVVRSIDPATPLPSVNDLPIGTTGDRDKKYAYNDVTITAQARPDLRSIIEPNGTNTTINQSYSYIAEQFALAEFILVNKLSQSVSLRAGGIATGLGRVEFDEHLEGVMVTTFWKMMNWRAYSACLLELIERLKAAGAFNDTVIAMASDFGRSPRPDGSGSDHGGAAAHCVFYSGCIQGPLILGKMQASNTYYDPVGYPGTWGTGTTDSTNDYGSLLVSAAAMLRVPSPLTAKAPLVADSAGTITALLEKSRLY